MILPPGAASLNTSYPFSYLYGLGYGGRVVTKQTAPVRTEIRDIVSLSPAAQQILDQAERLRKMEIR